jgi:DNA (cytosine-5)-methyltransferase 1
MNHIDLFSGIGGFAYAARQIWPDYNNLFFCDNNKFCQAVLRKNFGQDILIYDDIREVNYERFIADTQRTECEGTGGDTWQRGNVLGCCNTTVGLLTGGFPCQPFSVAGKQQGRDDERHLWPEMFRVIKDFSPRWVIAENVRGLINIENGMAFEQVCLDLESLGYTVQAFVIPACAVNAPHRRDRVWIVANSGLCGRIGQKIEGEQSRGTDAFGTSKADRHVADTGYERCVGWGSGSDTNGYRLQAGEQTGNKPWGATLRCTGWEQNWLEVATSLCGVDDGLPVELHGLKLSKPKHREERLKALGNAIVPQVVMEIMKTIKGL